MRRSPGSATCNLRILLKLIQFAYMVINQTGPGLPGGPMVFVLEMENCSIRGLNLKGDNNFLTSSGAERVHDLKPE